MKIIEHNGDTWKVLSEGTVHEGKTFCHLASTTRAVQQKNGRRPIQSCDWVPQEVLAVAKLHEECVPWRGAGGDLGKCVHCGESEQG